jgi:hypothetical protein
MYVLLWAIFLVLVHSNELIFSQGKFDPLIWKYFSSSAPAFYVSIESPFKPGRQPTNNFVLQKWSGLRVDADNYQYKNARYHS